MPHAAGSEWPGFQAHEFGRNEGTRWRSADGPTSLAPILLRQLQAIDPDFISFGVERSPEIHFAVSRRYRATPVSGKTVSKLVVYAHGPTDDATSTPRQVVAGWYVERGDGSTRPSATRPIPSSGTGRCSGVPSTMPRSGTGWPA